MSASNDRIEIHQDRAAEFRWRRLAGNNEIISQGEGYPSLSGAIKGAQRANPDVSAEQIEMRP